MVVRVTSQLSLLLTDQLEGVCRHVSSREEGGGPVHARIKAVILMETSRRQGASQGLGEAGQVVQGEVHGTVV